jgi:hypothetical protein
MTTVTGQHKDGQFFTEFEMVVETTLGNPENSGSPVREFIRPEEKGSDATPEHPSSSVTESDDLPQEVEPLTEHRFSSVMLNGLPRELQYHMFGYFTLEEFIALRGVSRRFRGLIRGIKGLHEKIIDILEKPLYKPLTNSTFEQISQASDLEKLLKRLVLPERQETQLERQFFSFLLPHLLAGNSNIERLLYSLAAFLRQPVRPQEGRAAEAQIFLNPDRAKMQRFQHFWDTMVAYKLPGNLPTVMIQTLFKGFVFSRKELALLRDPLLTTLHVAAYEGCLEEVRSLLEEQKKSGQLNIQNTDKEGSTALHFAAASGHANVVRLLLAEEAEFGPQNLFGLTPFKLAAVRDHAAVVKVFLEKGVQVDLQESLREAAENGLVNLVWLFLNEGAEINLEDSHDHTTPLHLAAAAGHVVVVYLLLEAGADYNLQDIVGKTALHYCKERDAVDLLLWAGANYELQDIFGNTAPCMTPSCDPPNNEGNEGILESTTDQRFAVSALVHSGFFAPGSSPPVADEAESYFAPP